MEALFITEIGKTEFKEVETPRPGPGEALLNVRHVGLCGSDLNTFRGLNPLSSLPRIPGHEIGGLIAETGSGVPEEFITGRSVIVIPYTVCGKCSSCLSGRVNACRYNKTLGVQQDGGMSGQIVVPHDRLITNDDLPKRHLALVEPLSVGFHAVARGAVAPGETVVVLGGGMIGVGAILGAQARGASVIAVEISEAKRPHLMALGVDRMINPDQCDITREIAELTNDLGPHVVIEAVGLPETFRSAIDLASFAGRVVYVGYAKSEVSYNTALFNLKELDIFGSRNAHRADFVSVIEFLTAHPDIADRLISKVFPWAEADQALTYWESNRNETFKVMVELPDVD